MREGAQDYDDAKLKSYNTGQRGTLEYKDFAALVQDAKGPALKRLMANSYSMRRHGALSRGSSYRI